ncbi:MAG TPA: DUF92 domain-containing protein [Thermoanaerobaculia bacterium]|jgi:uncharacterized protein (TIGR00297 family)
MPHATNELLRKSLHIAFGFGLLTLRLLPWPVVAAVCVAAVLSNWLLLHRLVGTRVSRHERGYDAGTVLYPVSVLVLVLVFRNALHYAAIGWALLAFGDGTATLVGKSFRTSALPWNRDKSIGGFAAFLIAGSAAALAAAWYMQYDAPLVVLTAAIAAAIAESLPLGVDDNVTVPFASSVALVIAGIHVLSPYAVWPHTQWWLIVNGVLALIGYFAHSVNVSGALGGFVLGAIIILGAGWPLYVALLVFFVIGTSATKLGYGRKARLGLAQESGGRRGFSHAFSNVGVAAICAIAVSRLARSRYGDTELELLPMFMGIASLATAAADTTASEIGQLAGRRAFLPLTLRRVPVGTEGAISVEGTLAGAIAGLVVAAIATKSVDAMFEQVADFSWRMIATVAICAFLGSYIESIAGSWNRKRMKGVPNGVLNFFNTVVGALLMYLAWQIAI